MTQRTNAASRRRPEDTAALMPWSFRLPMWGRLLVSIVCGIVVGLVTAVAHRAGVPWNVPYGLVLSFVVLGISAWSARARSGAIGLGFHLIASSAVTMLVTMVASDSKALIIFGYNADGYSFLMQKAGIIWLLGMVALQVVMVVMPERFFHVPPRKPTTTATAAAPKFKAKTKAKGTTAAATRRPAASSR